MPKRRALKRADVVEVYGGFKSLFQGDHLGVEFALESHTSVLRKKGLLVESETVLRHKPFPQGPCWQCLGEGAKKIGIKEKTRIKQKKQTRKEGRKEGAGRGRKRQEGAGRKEGRKEGREGGREGGRGGREEGRKEGNNPIPPPALLYLN